MAVLFVILLSLIAVLFVLYIFSQRKYDYWAKKNVPHIKPIPFFGNYMEYITLRKWYGTTVQEICQKFPNEPYIGAYFGTEPTLIVQDPELLKLITAKDFVYFNSREIAKYTDREINTGNMFFTYGDRWKVLRQNTSPLFTVSKIRNMFPLIDKCAKSLDNMLEYETSVSDVVEARSLIARYTMDCIGSCGFGVETNTMGKDNANNPFKLMGDLIFDNSTMRGLATNARAIFPRAFYGLGLKIFSPIITDFFDKLLLGVFKERNYKPTNRHDFVDLILNLKEQEYLTCDSLDMSKKGEKVSMKVDDEFLVSQCVLFFAAGFETSSTTSSFTLFELAKNPEAQQKVIKEVDEYLSKRNGKIEFDCVTELPYLEACINEGMRKYPIFGVITREVMADYTFPTGLKVEKGIRINIPVYHIHHDPKNFSEPEKFKPERHLPENKDEIKPYTFLPFGEGQRICIGMRLAKTQMMPGFITIFRKYRVELADGMPEKVDLEPRALVTQCKQGIRLKLIKRN